MSKKNQVKEKVKEIEFFIKKYIKLLNEIEFIKYYDGGNYYIEVNKSKLKRARMNLSETMLEMEKWLDE